MNLIAFYQTELQAILTFVCGVAFQFLFLLLPVDLKNWHDDLVNVLTYLAVQSFSAGILFFLLPPLIGAYNLSWSQGGYLFLVLNTIALLRVVWKIPLECSYPVIAEVQATEKIAFNDLYGEEKSELIELASSLPEANHRVERVRQQLVRVSKEASLLRGR